VRGKRSEREEMREMIYNIHEYYD
jgi:hypothetical protein